MMKIEIKFSDRLKPEECDMLLHTDIIEFLLKINGCTCRLYKTDICKDGIRGLINDPMKPMVFIKSFSKEDDKWFGEVEVPEPYRKYIPLMKTGYIHPVVMVDDDQPTGILYFEMRWIDGHLSED